MFWNEPKQRCPVLGLANVIASKSTLGIILCALFILTTVFWMVFIVYMSTLQAVNSWHLKVQHFGMTQNKSVQFLAL